MEKFKKTVYILSAVLCLFMFYGCSGDNEGNGEESSALLYLSGEKNEDEEPEDTEFMPKAKEPEFLSEEMDTRIRQDYFDAHILPSIIGLRERSKNDKYFSEASKDELKIMYYYGTYNESVPILFRIGYESYIPVHNFVIDIAGLQFYFPRPYGVRVWKEGKFYHLQETYDLNILTKNDMRNIAYYHSIIQWDEIENWEWDINTGWRSK